MHGQQTKQKIRMACIECGARFAKTISNHTLEIKCPKCGGYDTEPA